MDRIQSSNNVPNMFGAGKPGFSDNDDIPNSDATYMSPDFLNQVQEELCGPIEEVGIAVNNADMKQLLKSILILSGKRITSVNATAVLTAQQRGTVMVDGSGGDVLLTLPSADRFMDFTFVRVDNTAHKVVVQCAGTEKVLHNLWVNAAGYGFIRLFGAGDFWTLRSSAAGNWLPVERFNSEPIGKPSFSTSLVIPSGGLVVPDGSLLSRADYPWLWDYANASSNLRSEAAWSAGGNGGYSVGDGATNFRLPEPRGEFIRVLDGGRGVDAGRLIGIFADHMLEDHTHTTPLGNGDVAAGGSYVRGVGTNPVSSGGAQGANVGTETRPRSIAWPMLLKII